jgi:hypothetical protein
MEEDEISITVTYRGMTAEQLRDIGRCDPAETPGLAFELRRLALQFDLAHAGLATAAALRRVRGEGAR